MAIQITFHISVKNAKHINEGPNQKSISLLYHNKRVSPPSLMFESFTSSTSNKFLQ